MIMGQRFLVAATWILAPWCAAVILLSFIDFDSVRFEYHLYRIGVKPDASLIIVAGLALVPFPLLLAVVAIRVFRSRRNSELG